MTRPCGVVASLLVLATLAVACGGSSSGDRPDAARRVDVPGQVLAVSVTPGGGPLLFSIDKGVFGVARDGRRARAIRGELVNAGPEAVRIGRQLLVAGIDRDRVLGSGHPDRRGVRPYNLGLMLSQDAGRTWTPVSLLGRSDLHLLRLRGGLLYAYDLARDRFVATTDFGRTWTESRPPGLMLDLAFDPGRPQRLVASSSEGLVRSEDAGRSWQPLAREIGLRLAWPKPDALYLIDERGVVHRSRDGGVDREIVSTLGTPPEAITATGDGTLYAAGKDDTVRVSRDEGRSWQVELRLNSAPSVRRSAWSIAPRRAVQSRPIRRPEPRKGVGGHPAIRASRSAPRERSDARSVAGGRKPRWGSSHWAGRPDGPCRVQALHAERGARNAMTSL